MSCSACRKDDTYAGKPLVWYQWGVELPKTLKPRNYWEGSPFGTLDGVPHNITHPCYGKGAYLTIQGTLGAVIQLSTMPGGVSHWADHAPGRLFFINAMSAIGTSLYLRLKTAPLYGDSIVITVAAGVPIETSSSGSC